MHLPSRFTIGQHEFLGSTILAPMAGVTDRPFRVLCRKLGATLAVSEMLTADKSLWQSRKSIKRMDHTNEPGPISVQIAGGDVDMLVEAAKINADHGAQIIDINMGCPAKKVCKKAAGSALLKDAQLVADIIENVVNAIDIPVTVKIRTGWDTQTNNCKQIAKIAEDCGAQAIAIHGRSRACKYLGEAEYESIALAKQSVTIPVFANGDITSAQKAKQVLDFTQADAIMIGRAAQGNPWIFREIEHFLQSGEHLPVATWQEKHAVSYAHLIELHEFYGEVLGPQIARKHIAWYISDKEFTQVFNQIKQPEEQLHHLNCYFKAKLS
ncbi:tRNA dihydrouridine synthase DusB [Marinicellulosiphila megalodicopiae]|uniref:tRNA dihydrouridine synthase DusB n=1 Tax=Marinicellulosiphila megalodicopiae TaxID=2724896 RepID=UPI003BAF2B8D